MIDLLEELMLEPQKYPVWYKLDKWSNIYDFYHTEGYAWLIENYGSPGSRWFITNLVNYENNSIEILFANDQDAVRFKLAVC